MDMSHLQMPKHMSVPQLEEPSDLEELEQFAKAFKQRRIKLGFTQVIKKQNVFFEKALCHELQTIKGVIVLREQPVKTVGVISHAMYSICTRFFISFIRTFHFCIYMSHAHDVSK